VNLTNTRTTEPWFLWLVLLHTASSFESTGLDIPENTQFWKGSIQGLSNYKEARLFLIEGQSREHLDTSCDATSARLLYF
jgi:hypothetical protein